MPEGNVPDSPQILPATEASLSALRMLIFHLRDVVGKDAESQVGRASVTRGEMAHMLGLGTTSYDKLVKPGHPFEDAARHYGPAAKNLWPHLVASGPLPEPIQDLRRQVYHLRDDTGGAGRVVKDPVVLKFQSMFQTDATRQATVLPIIMGLAVLVRPSNDMIDAQPSFSVSLLNIVPPQLGAGSSHPVFKLRQRGSERTFTVDVEGVVIVQNDRVTLSGRDQAPQGPRHGFNMTLPFNDDLLEDYQNARAPLFGVMKGLSSSARRAFVTLCQMYPIPGGHLDPETATPKEQERFDTLLEQLRREEIGVFARNQLLEKFDRLEVFDMGDYLTQLSSKAGEKPLSYG